MKVFQFIVLTVIAILISACATSKMQVSKNQKFNQKKDSSKLVHSFYLIGDAGNSTLEKDAPALVFLKEKIKDAPKKSTLIFLGDNVYETGVPKKNKKKEI